MHSQDTRQTATADRELAVAQHLIDLHFEIWNDPNPAHWPAKFPQVYSHDFFLADYAGLARGYPAVSTMIEKVQGAHPGFAFTPEPVTWNHGVGRVTWGYGPRDNPNLIRGEDIFTIEGGKLASARVFINSK
ncbi:nuclear transport factor 2 family protein [Burkholderia sp. Ac-20379]|nr:nuclear transport factor 2 family protein [Burkholderia sp. Ac-20379]